MPVVCSADPAGRFVLLTLGDPYTIDQWRAAAEAVFQEPVYLSRRAVLVDRRNCEPPSSDFVAQMTRFADTHRPAMAGAHVAVVVSDDAGFGMARMSELQNPSMAIRTFRRYEHAERWLFGSSSDG